MPILPEPADDRSELQLWIDRLGATAFRRIWSALPDHARQAYAYDWWKIARKKQLPPPGNWRTWSLRAGRGFGKALALDTLLPTPSGWTTMGEVRIGDVLFDERGQPCHVTFATGVQFGRPCNDVRFSDGTVIVADDDHRWETWTSLSRRCARVGRPGGPTVVNTSDIRTSLFDNGCPNHSVELSWRPGAPHLHIVDVRRVPSVPVRCIQVDSPSHLFLASRAMIPTHNTRTGSEWVRWKVETGQCGRLALVAATAADARDVMVEGNSGLLATARPDFRPTYEPSKRRITWPNGAVATLFSAEEPDRLRGPQYDGAWADELAAWARLEETWDMLQFGLRLGFNPQAVVTSTPRGLKFLRTLEADPTTVTTIGSTYENEANLAGPFLSAIKRKYEGTRLGLQEILAQILDDNPGALWKRGQIDAKRLSLGDFASMGHIITSIVVALDPATTSKSTSDEHGIIVTGVGMCNCNGKPRKHGFVLEDRSGIYTPVDAADKVVTAYESRMANEVVGETNQGGDWIEAVLRTHERGQNLVYRGVHAKDGKRLRAEPVSSLYEQGCVHHVGLFAKLEDEMCQWDPSQPGESPNRIDALVHGLTRQLVEKDPPPYDDCGGDGLNPWER